MRRNWGVFANKWFSLYFLTATLSEVGSQIYRLAIPWIVLEMTNSIAAMSAMLIVETAPFILLGPLLGVLVDRWDRRKIMLWSDFARAVLIALLPALAWFDALQLWHLFVVGFFLTIFTICFDLIADFGLIPQLVNKSQLTAANSARMAIGNLSTLAGPALAGVAIMMVGAKNALLIDAISYFLTLVVVFFLPVNFQPAGLHNQKRLSVSNVIADIKEGFTFVSRSTILRTLALNSFLVNLALAAMFTVMTYRLGNELHLEASIVGSVYSIMGGMALLGTLLAPHLLKKLAMGKAITINYIVTWCGTILLASITDWRLALIGYAFISLTMSISNIYTFTIRQWEIPAQLMGRVNSSYRMVLVLAFPFSAALLGGLANRYGAVSAFIGAAVLMTVVVLFTVLSSIPAYREKENEKNLPLS